MIGYSPTDVTSNYGIFFLIVDLSGNGILDIVAPGKDGLFVFENLGQNWDARDESIGAQPFYLRLPLLDGGM